MPGELAPLRTNVSQGRRHNEVEAKPRSSSPAVWASSLTSHMGSVFYMQPPHLGNMVVACARSIPAQSLHGATSGSSKHAPSINKNRSYDHGPWGMTGYPREVTAEESKGCCVHRMCAQDVQALETQYSSLTWKWHPSEMERGREADSLSCPGSGYNWLNS